MRDELSKRVEWPGKLTRADAIKLLDRITDNDDPYWENKVEDWYDEATDTMPTIYHLIAALGVSEAEYKSLHPGANIRWPTNLLQTEGSGFYTNPPELPTSTEGPGPAGDVGELSRTAYALCDANNEDPNGTCVTTIDGKSFNETFYERRFREAEAAVAHDMLDTAKRVGWRCALSALDKRLEMGDDAPDALRSGVQAFADEFEREARTALARSTPGDDLVKANDALAFWLSAALEDPGVCAEFKAAINRWFEVAPLPPEKES